MQDKTRPDASGPTRRMLHSSDIEPSVGDLRRGLKQVLDEGYEAVWASICTRAGADPTAANLNDGDFEALLSALGDLGPLCAVLATSWRIRRTAARKLAELGR